MPILQALWALGTATSAEIAAYVGTAGWTYQDAYNMTCSYLLRMTRRGLVTRTPRPVGTLRPGYLYTTPHQKEALTALVMGE